jgi:NADPH:quinone reductase-like Zn-dependent oxidoreductase
VQGAMGAQARTLLVPDGRWVLCGHAGGLAPIDPHFYMSNHTLVGATLGGYARDVMRAIEQETQDAIVAMWRAGTFRPVTTEEIAFTDVPDALDALGRRATRGRVVVRVAE